MDWTHAPLHRTNDAGWYFITAGTYLKQHLMADESRRAQLLQLMRDLAPPHGLELQEWVVLSDHYHIMLLANETPDVTAFIRKLHSKHAHVVNATDNFPGRKIWFQYWDKFVRDERSYLARINYIHQNPVKHGYVRVAEHYPWSSARAFSERAEIGLLKAVRNFKTDTVKVPDDF